MSPSTLALGGRPPQSSERPIYITASDRQRLDAVLRDAVAGAAGRRDELVALRGELERAIVVESADVPRDVVTMNSTVRVRDLDTGEENVYSLVYPTFADIVNDRLSVLAPVGTAILGCRTGDVVEWQTPSGAVRLAIDAVEYQPEREGRRDL